jgi:hypothetical protein
MSMNIATSPIPPFGFVFVVSRCADSEMTTVLAGP